MPSTAQSESTDPSPPVATGHDNTRSPTAEPQAIKIDLPHLQMAALAWGPPDGTLVLCLHGYPDTAWTWRQLGPALAARGFRVVAPFTRGYAPTAIPADGDYHIGALMFDAMELYRHLGGGFDAVLIGHDWGGFTAVGLAAHPNNPFVNVVAVGVPLLYGFRTQPVRRMLSRLPDQARKSWYVLYQQIPGLSDRTIERVIPRLWRDWCPTGFDINPELDRVWASLPTAGHRAAALSYYRFQFQPRKQSVAYRNFHRTWRTQPLRIPILLLHGEIDGGLDTRLATISAAGLPRHSRHEIIPGAGHFMHLDEPDLVNKLIVEYLMRVTES